MTKPMEPLRGEGERSDPAPPDTFEQSISRRLQP